MLVATFLIPVLVAGVIIAIQRFRLPAWFVLMAAALAYGILADRNLQSYGRAFALGFANAVEQAGLLLVFGGVLAKAVRGSSLPAPWAAASGLVCGVCASPAGALGILHGACGGASRRALLMVLLAIATPAMLIPSPVASAAAWVVQAHPWRMLSIGLPIVAIVAVGTWLVFRRELPEDASAGGGSAGWGIAAAMLALMFLFALAQVPSEPLGAKSANLFYTNLGRPFVVAVIGLCLLLLVMRGRPPADWGEASWAPLLLAVGASGGLSFVLNETGAPELVAEKFVDPRFGLLVPFLTAAIVKTMQGSSLTAVLTASGMTEPLLAQLGLDSEGGRLAAAGAAGAGSIALCHINDPLFWIAAHMTGLPPARALALVAGGSALLAGAMLALLYAFRCLT